MSIYKLDYALPMEAAFETIMKNPKIMNFKKSFKLNDEIGEITILVNFLGANKMTITLITPKVVKEIERTYKDLQKGKNIIRISFSEEDLVLLNLNFRREDDDEHKYFDYKDIIYDLENDIQLGKRKQLLDYMEYLDFNYLLNVIYGGYILIYLNYNNQHNTYDDIVELERDYNKIREMFISKLNSLGIEIPKINKSDVEKITSIIYKINYIPTITPEDCVFLFMVSIPEGFKERNKYINRYNKVIDAMNDMFEYIKDLEVI